MLSSCVFLPINWIRKMMKSDLIDGLLVNRRSALKALAGISAMAVGGGVLAQSKTTNVLGSSSASDFDYSNPYDNLYAFGKMWAGYDKPQYGAYHGVMYGRAGGNRHEALFGYTGTGVMQAKIDENGHLSIRGKETGFYTDLATGNILEEWRNPYTNELVKPLNFINTIGVKLTTEIPRFAFGAKTDEPTVMNAGMNKTDDGKVPFILPFESYGDDLLLGWDYAHGYTNPVTKDKWPKAHTGDKISPSEHFTIRISKAEMEDRSIPSCRFVAGFSRVSEWWPWMLMGQSKYKDGVLFGRMFSHKGLPGYQDIPPKLLAYIEKNHPDSLEVPSDWKTLRPQGTWEKYTNEVPPEKS
jgi:hypothetical protein